MIDRLSACLCILSAAAVYAGPVDQNHRPLIRKLGTVDCDLVEATPVVFQGRVYRFEWARKGYAKHLHPGETWAEGGYFRFVDHATGEPTPPFGHGYAFGSAFVEGETVYVTGTSTEAGWTGRRVRMFASKDLKSWEQWDALNLDGFGICNTSLCKADDQYVLMFEIHKPVDQAGAAFTARFAVSKNLRDWKLTPPECVYAKDRYTAPHCLRYLDGYFYDFYLEAHNGYETRVVRSKDLIHWQASPLNPVLKASKQDRRVWNPDLLPGFAERIATATDLNNSDIDFCEYNGRLIISYSWGNQHGVEHLAEAEYDGTEAEFLKGWFPEDPPKPAEN